MNISDDSVYFFRRSLEEAHKASMAVFRGDAPAAVSAHEELAMRYHMRALAQVVGTASNRNDEGELGPISQSAVLSGLPGQVVQPGNFS